ncbi:hypothetical protein IV102_16405 [bacterium]|nr:hypothetical protein [bacterium]
MTALRLFTAALAFLIPFCLHASFILNHFYRSGAYFFDAGLYAALMWRDGWLIPVPDQGLPYLLDGTSYYKIHLTLMLGLASLLSYGVPLDRVHLFAGYIGFCYGLMSLSIYWVLSWGFSLPGRFWPLVWLMLALLFAHGGLAIAIARYPHTEVMAVGLLIFFFGFWLRRQYGRASLFFFLALLVREDCGSHVCAILGLLMCDRYLKERGSWRHYLPYLLYGGIGLSWTLAAIAVQKFAMGGGEALGRTFAGGLPLSPLPILMQKRIHLWLPVLGTLLSGLALRSRPQVLAVLAFLPWTCLHLYGSQEAPATLVAYYGYPFLLTFAWILLAQAGQSATLPRRLFTLGTFAAIQLLSLGGLALQKEGPLGFLQAAWPSAQTWNGGGLEEFLADWKEAGLARLGVHVDMAVLSLAPRDFPPGTWLHEKSPQGSLDGMLFFRNTWDFGLTMSQLVCIEQPRFYQVKCTPMVVAAARDLAIPAHLRSRLEPVSGLAVTHQSRVGRRLGTGFAVHPREGPGAFLVLACKKMQSARYDCFYRYHLLGPGPAEMVMKVWVDYGRRCLSEQTFELQGQGVMRWSFEIRPTDQELVEIVLHGPTGAEVSVDDFEITLQP